MRNMKSYILGNKSESERLNFQSRQRNYSPRTEISVQELALFEDAKVLDAGCGTGLFSRYIADLNAGKNIEIFAIDASEQRIAEAKNDSKNSNYKNITFSKQDLRSLDFPNNYLDIVICRFVYEHIKDICQEVSNELFRVLKPDGKLFIIDSDGILFNMDSEDEQLDIYLDEIKSSEINFEGFICRKIPRYLQRAGFHQQDIKISPKPMLFFEDEDRNYEKTLWQMRFSQIKPVFTPILGEEGYFDFTNRFISELMNPQNFLYYNKFVFKATKKDERSSH